jgi:SAM-dependent methyltransferase
MGGATPAISARGCPLPGYWGPFTILSMSSGPLSGKTPLEAHQDRAIAESFGAEAARYERTRPTYPKAMIDAILAASPGRDVLDVGIGTGISARPFQQDGRRVLGVEPDERMAEYARQSGLEVEIATFEEWDRAGRSFDLVIAGQSWHWVDPVLGAAKAADSLRPGGRIALFWNVMSYAPEFAEGLSAVYQRILPEFPFFKGASTGGTASYAPLADKAADGIRQTGALSEPERWEFDWERAYARDEWLETVPTFGGHSQLPPEKLDALLSGIGNVVDAAGGSITIGYTALVITARRITQDHAGS